ncbi:MAG: RNA polymerase-binding protein RbpA [Actinobacteria bacterium]|nr:RNA polymerase-binding protein RbpA [Actinomycetota bacterium]
MAETMRGMRLGAQSLETDAGVEFSPRVTVDFQCPEGHEFNLVFAATAELPDTWECKKCEQIAVRLENGLPIDLAIATDDGPRTHYDMVLERRSREELEELLAEVLADMRARRSAGKLTA